MTFILLSLLGCERNLPPVINPDPIGCVPDGTPMPLGSAERFLGLWAEELSYELLDHMTLQMVLESYAEVAIDASVRSGAEACPSLHYRDDGYEIDAGEGCEAGDGTRWGGRVEVHFDDAQRLTVYEGFAFSREDPEQGDLELLWTGSFEHQDDVDLYTISVEGYRVGAHDSSSRPADGWVGRLDMVSDGREERESFDWVIDENLQDPAMVGGLCGAHYSNRAGDLEIRARGADDVVLTLVERCAEGSFNNAPVSEVCL